MKASITKNKAFKPIMITVAALFWTFVWYIAAFGIGNEVFLPYPHSVLKAFWKLVITADFWKSTLFTMLTVVAGCQIGFLIGAVLGILASVLKPTRYIISPLITVLRATPVASIIILVYAIVRRIKLPVNSVSIIIIVFMVIPIIYGNLVSGIEAFDKDLAEVAQIFRFSLRKKITVLWLPQLSPYMLSGATNAVGFAWKAGVAAEVICYLNNTIGRHLADSKSNLEMDILFAWTFTVIIFSMLFEVLFKKVLAPQRKKGGSTDDHS